MRRSSICLVVLLVLSSFAIAQHHEAPSAPAPSPAPVATPSVPAPPPSSPPPPAPTAPSPSAPTASAAHIAPTPSIPESHITTQAQNPTPRAEPASRASQPETGRVTSAPKITGDEKISSAPRIGEADKDRVAKPGEPDLRHRVCEGAACKENPQKPEPSEADLRHRICPDGHCECPPGKTAGKTGCVTSQPSDQCSPGQVWNGASCAESTQCPAGQIRNGASCLADCSAVNGMTANLILQLRSLHQDRDAACGQDPSGNVCVQVDGRYRNALGEYENAWASAPTNCRGLLPVPQSI